MGRHSLKVKITLLLAAITTSLVLLILFINAGFAEKFYMDDKQDTMLCMYDTADDIVSRYYAEEINSTEMENLMEQSISKQNLSIIIVNSDWTTIYSSNKGESELKKRLEKSIFNSDILSEEDKQNADVSQENGDIQPPLSDNKVNDGQFNGMINQFVEDRIIILQTDKYTLQKVFDPRLNDFYLELWGTLSSSDAILIRLPVQSVMESISISSKFISIIGIVVIALSIIIVYIFSSYITKPIIQLSNIAEQMSHLDFNVKYSGKDKGEIGILGKSMNDMSERLEQNISQLKSANVELQRDIAHKIEIDEMRTEFLSNVSHELKTPISLIQGYAEGLKEGISDDPESMDFYCDVIIDEANKMNNMVKKLLTLNQIECGNEELVMERFDITELIKSIVTANELRASQKDIKIIFKCDEPVFVWSDEYKIEEVITNYLSNAINHCEFEKEILININQMPNDNIRVSVFNTGKNIPEEDIDNIWIKFYKVDKARTREYGGNGIGLSIVKAILDSYGKKCGAINRENGVEFWFEVDSRND